MGGSPGGAGVRGPQDRDLSPFGLFWTALSVWGFALVSWDAPPELSGTLGIMRAMMVAVSLIGVAFLAIPFWISRIARSTAYVITDRRVLIVGRLRSWRVTTIPPDRIGTVTRSQRADGSGTVAFGTPAFGATGGAGLVVFQRIADAKHVEALLRDLAASAND